MGRHWQWFLVATSMLSHSSSTLIITNMRYIVTWLVGTWFPPCIITCVCVCVCVHRFSLPVEIRPRLMCLWTLVTRLSPWLCPRHIHHLCNTYPLTHLSPYLFCVLPRVQKDIFNNVYAWVMSFGRLFVFLWFKLQFICSPSREALCLEEHSQLTPAWQGDTSVPIGLLQPQLLTHRTSYVL